MDDNERRRYEMLVRVRQFGTDNAGDFPAGSVGDTQFTAVGTAVDGVESEAGKQQAGFGEAAQQFEVKGTARENSTRTRLRCLFDRTFRIFASPAVR